MAQSAVIHEEFVYSGHNAVIHAVCYNRVQDCFVTCDDATLRLWQPTKTGSELRQVSLPPRTSNFIQAIEFVELRQAYVASALDGTLKIYDLELNEIASVFAGRSAIVSLAFDSVHNKLFSGGVDGCAAWQVRGKPLVGPESVLNPLYDLASIPGFFHYATGLSKLQQQPQSQLPAVTGALSPAKGDSSATSAQRVSILSVPKPSPPSPSLSKKRGLEWVQSVQLTSEQTRLYAHAKHRVDVYSTTDGHHIDTFTELVPQESGAITAFVLHEKTQYLVCGCINGYIYVLSVHPTSTVHVFKDHTMAVTGLAVHLSSHLIISSSLDGTVRLWDLEARRQAHRLDIRQPVYSMGILTPRANPCRFYCRVRSAVQLFTIRSAAKEHLSSLSPISILQRVTFPTAATVKQHDGMIPGEKLSSTRQIVLPSTRENEESGDEEEASRPLGVNEKKQWIVAAGTDRTIRLFTGRAANEAPSFTWIPEEHALDVSGFSLHPVGNKLYILLDSQSIVVVDIVKKPKDADAEDETERPRRHRMIDMNAAPLSLLVPSTSQSSASLQPSLSTKKSTLALGSLCGDKSISRTSSTNGGLGAGGTNTAANPTLRGAVRSICCCFYPPIFRSTAAVAGDATAQLKWFSRTFVNRRQQSKRDLKKLDDLTSTSSASVSSGGVSPSKSASWIQSDREWIVCGSEHGHLIFWHSGLTNSFQEAISLDAHDASIIALSASASSPLLVSLDASKRVHIWQFQPVFTLRQMVELNESPTCFVLSPETEIVLTGYEDGSVVLMHVGESLEQIETCASTEENHDAMVSAADFLDAKLIVLTASVDAVIKIWDHQKNLLRQIQIAMALTCVCFMNDDGDVMAGVPTGIFMLSKDDLLPDKLPVVHTMDDSPGPVDPADNSPNSRHKKLPFWLSGEGQASSTNGSESGVSAGTSYSTGEASAKSASASSAVKGMSLFRKKANVSFQDEAVALEAPPSPVQSHEAPQKADESAEPERTERGGATDAKASSSSKELAGDIAWKRRAHKELMTNSTNPLSSLNKPITMLHPPVLRPIENNPRRPNEPMHGNQHRATPPTSSRPLSSRTMFPGKDPDWREVIMPSSPFHKLKSRHESPRHRQSKPPSQSATIIAELKALAHSPKRLLSPPRPIGTPPTADTDGALAIGVADGDRTPLQYCKHQAPVPPKAKTPRKLWNAIGGEDRRLIAVQRNLPSL